MNKYILFLITSLIFSCSSSNNEEAENEEVKEAKAEFRVDEKYTTSIVRKMDNKELRVKRNEIFAQYGYKFKSQDLIAYFSSKDWYEPNYDNVDLFLTQLDKENIKILLAEEASRNSEKNFDCNNFSNDLPNFSFSSSITVAIDSLGAPDRTFIDDDQLCPIGQLHYWNENINNQQLVILGDDYSGNKNYSAKSRVYAIKSLNTSRSSAYSFNRIKLGEKSKVVKQKIDCLMSMNSNFKLSENEGKSKVEKHFVGNQKKQFVISRSDLFIRFIIDNDDRLKSIVFSSFNYHIAC